MKTRFDIRAASNADAPAVNPTNGAFPFGTIIYNESRGNTMTTFNTIDELLDILDKNPRLLEAVRAKILTEELIKLPHEFDEFKSEMKEFRKDTEKNFDRVDRRLDSLEGKVEKNSVDINGLGDMFREEVKAQSSFRGTYAVDASRKDNREVAWLFAYKHGLRLIKTRQVPDDALENWLANNVALIESLNLRDRAWRTFPGADLVVEVRDLQARLDSTPAYYIALEASYTVEKEDILKSTDHARIIRAVTGVDTYAVVAGVNMDDEMDAETLGRVHTEAERFIETDDPETAFWHQLHSEDLRPSEPR